MASALKINMGLQRAHLYAFHKSMGGNRCEFTWGDDYHCFLFCAPWICANPHKYIHIRSFQYRLIRIRYIWTTAENRLIYAWNIFSAFDFQLPKKNKTHWNERTLTPMTILISSPILLFYVLMMRLMINTNSNNNTNGIYRHGSFAHFIHKALHCTTFSLLLLANGIYCFSGRFDWALFPLQSRSIFFVAFFGLFAGLVLSVLDTILIQFFWLFGRIGCFAFHFSILFEFSVPILFCAVHACVCVLDIWNTWCWLLMVARSVFI